MLFNSLEFILFIAVVLLVYRRLAFKGQNTWLLLVSYFFYGWWDWRFLGLLFLSTVTDYICGLKMIRSSTAHRRKWWLAISLIVNLGVLGLFKYFNFFQSSFIKVLGAMGMQPDWATLNIILPVGISFYTFQTLSYTIDVYRGELVPTKNMRDFALYVAFFPQLVAGPIERATSLLPQIQCSRTVDHNQWIDGWGLILFGYVKKVVIADHLARFVDMGFSSTASPFMGMDSWGLILAFACQIYGDFSGYSDIARGLAKLLGFELMVNFKQPYLVRNISHFWRHWHISLSTWLRDYLYIPLGGNRARGSRTLANLIIVMGLGGLWHGAGWWFVLWGLYIGMLLVLHRLLVTGLKRCGPLMTRIVESRSWHLLCVLTTFILVCVGWLLFRVASVPDVARQWLLVQSYLSHMFSGWFSGDAIPYVRALLLLGGGAFVFQWFHETFEYASEWNPVVRNSIWILCIMLVLILGKADGTDFIYFQF